MAGVGTLLSGPPSEVWARSLRQETALQDHYRRAIHHCDGGVANVGFGRWNAACCLQEQVDCARGVEHTRRLVKCRAIAARFTRRSVMKDLQGTELQTTSARANSTSGASTNYDTLSRSQALERFGIDLGRVGVMTSARTASRHSLIDDGSGKDQGAARGDDGTRVAVATNLSSDAGGTRRGEEAQYANRIENKRGRGGSSGMTTVTKDTGSSKRIVARRQQVMSEKLKVLDKLLSDEFLCQIPADEDRGKKGKTANQSENESSEGVFERNGDDSVDISADVCDGGDGKGGKSRLDVLPAEEAPSCTTLDEKTAFGCDDSQALVTGPKKATTAVVAAIHAPDYGERGDAADAHNAVLRENATMKVAPNGERHLCCKEALPNHRPCLWWACLLPPDVEGVSIPDMVFPAPTAYPVCCNKRGMGTGATGSVSTNQNDEVRTTRPLPSTGSRDDAATNVPADSITNRQSTKSCSQQSLLWAFSKAAKREDGDGRAARSPSRGASKRHLGVASLVESEGGVGGPATAYLSKKESSRAGKLGVRKNVSAPLQHPPEQRFYTKVIDGKEGLLCATRAICESGRRGGGGTGSEEGASKLNLPLALLKVWGSERDEERGRKNLPEKLGTPCRGRRLRVVSLWTQTEVLGALRDMARGRWLRRGEQSEKKSGLFGSDQDACCVQAFTRSGTFTDEGDNDPRGGAGVGILTRIVDGGNEGRREGRASPEDSGLSRPVFYRAAWRRTGEKLFVWKITSRYPYVSSLSAHFCPLVRVGSAAPFTASQAEEGAVAAAKTKMDNLAKALRRAYDPTLQRLWADWAVNKSDGRWLLIEVHGVKTDADVHNAAVARAAPSAFAEVESKVYRSTHRIPPKHFCGDPGDLTARLAAANPTQELSLVEISNRAAAVASKHRPSRPPTPSKVAASTTRALLAQTGAASEQALNRRKFSGARQMRNQYWRCAGDFCETQSVGQSRKSPRHTKVDHDKPATNLSTVERQSTEGVRAKKSSGETTLRGTGAAEEDSTVGGAGRGDGTEYEVEDIIGRRKHALAVEMPRTVLFRLVLNARAALLGWRPSSFDFSQMEKPVQLCSVCFMVCNTLERERIETTRRAMDAADQAAKEGKARRNRRPPGWKSRVQHELEESLDADRHAVSHLIDSFETTSAATAEGKKKKVPPFSAPSSSRGNNRVRPRQKGSEGSGYGGMSVTWADRCPLEEVRLDEEEDDAGASSQSTPRGKTSTSAAGGTTMVASARRTKTAPVAPTPGKKRLVLAQKLLLTDKTPLLGASAKEKPEEEGKKREIRARRKAKERARRRVRNLASDNARARHERGELPGKKGNDTVCLGGKSGGTQSTEHRKRGRERGLPTILRPTVPDDALTSDAYLLETSGHNPPGQPRQLLSSVTPKKELGEEELVRGEMSDNGDDNFTEDIQPQLLRPIASRENWGEKERVGAERQGDRSEKIGRVPVGREEPNSDYGDEDFEDDAT